MKILLTGGSGFLGQRVIRRLVSIDHEVIALVRSRESAETVKSIGAIPVQGDITQIKDFSDSLRGVDVVIHCAAPVEFWGPWEKYQSGIIDATLSLAQECSRQNVKRFIHISSESVLQDTEELVEVDEDYSYPSEPNSFYGKAKKITEEQLLKLSSRMEVIIIRPSFIWGLDCPSFATLTEKVNSRQFVWIDQGKISFEAVHVENVAEAICLSFTNGKDRQIYFVTDNEASTVREFFESLFRALNLPTPGLSLPGLVARPLASLVEGLWRAFRLSTHPPLTRFDLAFVAIPRNYRIDRIKNDLGYVPVMTRAKGFQELSSKTRI